MSEKGEFVLLKKISCLFLVILFLLSSAACKGNEQPENSAFDNKSSFEEISDEIIAENDNYKLRFDSKTAGIILIDLMTGKEYRTTPQQSTDSSGVSSERLNPQVMSPVWIDYLNRTSNSLETAISYRNALRDGRVAFKKTENGAIVNYYFDAEEIMIPVEYTLKSDGVDISVISADIQENRNLAVKVHVAPFMCSAANAASDSYIFYPSGSGALVYPRVISQTGEEYSAEVYGRDMSVEMTDRISNEKNIRIPAFGVKNGNNAVLGIIENGAESANVELRVGSTALGYSTVYASFNVRTGKECVKESFSKTIKTTLYSNAAVKERLTVSYYPISSETPSYTDMARLCREKLIKSENSINSEKVSQLSLTAVGGAVYDKSFLGVPYKSFYSATTVDHVKSILEDLSESEVEVSNICLAGFGEKGIDIGQLAGGFKIASELGNKKQLSQLYDICKKLKTDLYFDFDTVNFKKSGGGFNIYGDTVIGPTGKAGKQYLYDKAILSKINETYYYLLSREKLVEPIKKVIDITEEWKIDGISLGALSNTAYSDYSSKANTAYNSKSGMSKQVGEVYNEIITAGRKIMSDDANFYAAELSSVIKNAPTISAQARLFDEDIPFYEMVFRGYTEIYSESVNLCSDSRKQILRSIESGSGISYTVTNNYGNELLGIEHSVFYNSRYKDLKQDIVNHFNELKEYYGKIANSKIADHKIYSTGLRETVFSNGVRVYVNYGENEIISPAGTVKPCGYLVKEEFYEKTKS